MWISEQEYTPANPTISDKVVFTLDIYNRLASLAVMVPIDHYFSYNIGLSFQGPQKKKKAKWLFVQKRRKT